MIDAPTDVANLLASRPRNAFRANLFTFNLVNGETYRFTDWRRPLTVGGQQYLAGPQRIIRGGIRVDTGLSVATQKVTFQEANGDLIAKFALGYFRRALYQMDRIFAADAKLQWTSPITRFCGRLNSIDALTATSLDVTIKSMLDDLDRDYPFAVIEPDCDAAVFDVRCGLDAASYKVSDTAASGSNKLKLVSGLSAADDYFTQGVVTFTSGVMNGLSYMVKSYKSGVIIPAYPFLTAIAVGDTFTVTPGCDKTLATCRSKFGYNPSSGAAPYFRGTPFVPDPTVTY